MSEKRDRKYFFLLLIFGLIINFGVFGYLSLFLVDYKTANDYFARETMIVATESDPLNLDPLDSWDSASYDVIRQVCEPIFFHNLTDPSLPLINWLCESYSWNNNITITIKIKVPIFFHDGTVMDAAACAWNFNRLLYLCNHTGELPINIQRAKIHSLFEFPNGDPIINRTNLIDTKTFQIILNAPFSQFLALMAYISCSILSPSVTPFDHYLDIETDDLVGTGPYMYDYYITATEVRFTRWEDYWGSPAGTGKASFEVMIFDIIHDPITRNYALKAGDVDILTGISAEFYNDFNASSNITFFESENPSLGLYYLSINNDITNSDGDPGIGLNITWRKTIAWVINYTQLFKIVEDYHVVRAYSLISPGFGDFFDLRLPSRSIPNEGNITHARKIIQDNLGPVNSEIAGRDIYKDEDWEINHTLGEEDPNWLKTINYSYNKDNSFKANFYEVLSEWLALVGVFVEDGGTDWEYFLYRAYGYVPGGYDQLQIFWILGNPNYLDPMNIIQPLVSNISKSNSAQVSHPWIEGNITKYNTDVTLSYNERKWIIWNLTWICTNYLYCHIYGYHFKNYWAHSSNLHNIPYNVLNYFWAYPITRISYST